MPTKFTPTSIDSFRPRDQPYLKFDTVQKGLSIRVSPQNAKTFRFRMRGEKVVTLGPYSLAQKAGHVTIKQARDFVGELSEARRAGPAAVAEVETRIRSHLAPSRVVPDGGKTIDEIAEAFWKVLDTKRKRGSKEAADMYKLHLKPRLGPMSLKQIKKSDCRGAIDLAAKRAPVRAGKVLAILKQLLSYAERHFADSEDTFINPAATLKAEDFGIQGGIRERWLNEAEIVAFWHSLGDQTSEKERQKVASVLRLLLLTGLRTGELRQTQWENVDVEGRTLTIPVALQKLQKKQEKKAKPFVIPLTPLAVGLFETLRALTEDSPWVLPSADSKNGIYGDKAIGRFMRRHWEGEKPPKGSKRKRQNGHPALAPFDLATPHDLRRTVKTWLGKLGVRPHVSELVLNHKPPRVEQHYDQHDYFDERRAALELWDAKIQGLISSSSI